MVLVCFSKAFFDIARDLKERGVYVMLSNSECPLIYDLYENGFNIDVIQVGRAINSKASKTGGCW